ncbi:hypothetical protein DSOUD_2596 [Desulfuromonas soudanensis]|uniref:DUF481 domain-containing protein n=1 Tax=Desulfuromonas soudanensis TaxID=1603606 RepID=A0A0M3QG45_9BACT|nr:hypothetical protein [Desulfuromonas soudanensis]ALC17349.1 hypothetical protein DSOUD_2596 [Desulfuromonas soudanensis]
MKNTLLFTLLVLALFFGALLGGATASEGTVSEGTVSEGTASVAADPLPPEEEEEPNLPASQAISEFHEYFSGGVEALSRRIDAFFGSTRIYEEASGTYLQMRGNVIYGRSGEIGFDGKVRARLDLPNLEERVHLVIESEEEETVSETRVAAGSTPAQAVDEKKLTTSLQYVVKSTRRWDVRLQPGIRVNMDPRPFLRLRFRLMQPLSETWLSRTTLTPGWFEDRGWEGRAFFDFERATGGGSLFRSSTQGVWLFDEPKDVQLTQSLLYAHPIGSRVQMAYQFGVTAEVDPKFQDTFYFLNVRYRKNIHQGWMFLELQPQVLFDREDDFKPDASFSLTLEILIGGRYL